MIRVAFLIPITQSWLGGFNYFRNLLGALLTLPERTVEPVIMGDLSHLGYPFRECESLPLLNLNRFSWQWCLHKCGQLLLDNGGFLPFYLRRRGIQLLSHTSPLGRNCSVPALGWIPDFQHRYFPEFFTKSELDLRDNNMAFLAKYARGVILSSHEAYKDFCHVYPSAAHKAYLLQFVASTVQAESFLDSQQLAQRFQLAEPYFHIPNQFWIHKNHAVVIEALRILKSRGRCPLVVSTGNTDDHRCPGFFQDLGNKIAQYGLEERFRILGIVKEEELTALMRNAMAMINPSLFEGWSTTVEEAKSLGKRILLSDIPVHREQAPERGVFFPPHDPEVLAHALQRVTETYDLAEEAAATSKATVMLASRQQAFGHAYEAIVNNLLYSNCGLLPENETIHHERILRR